MPNPIKYTTGTESQALKKGNFYIGTGDVGKGPSDTTGFYQGISPSSGGYVIYMNKSGAPGDLSYHNAPTDAELISFTNSLAGQSYTTVNECFNYYNGQSDKLCVNRDYESIVTDGLIFNLDANFIASYPRNGTDVYDLSGKGNDGTLINGVGFTNSGVPRFQLDGTDDRIQVPKDLNGFTHNIQYDIDWTIECWMYTHTPDGTPQTYKQIYGNYNGCNYTELKGNGQGILIYNANNSATCFMNFGFGPKNTGVPCCSPSQCPEISLNFTNAETSWFYNDAVNKWCHFIMTSDDGTYYKIYINGVQQGSTKTLDFKNSQSRIDNNLTSTSNYSWGGNNSTSFNEVDFSCMRIYNKPLSATEVLQNYNAQKGRFGL